MSYYHQKTANLGDVFMTNLINAAQYLRHATTLTPFMIAALTATLFTTPSFASQTLKATGNIKWTGYKVQKIGDSHTGDLRLKSGTVQIDGDKILGGEFVIDMNTLTYKNKKLEGHLKSPDFFDVAKFQEAKFVIKRSEKLAATGPHGETHKFLGDLTIRGNTRPFDILATVKSTKAGWTANSKTVIPDRTLFDINYNSPGLFGLANLADKAIADEIKLELNVTAK